MTADSENISLTKVSKVALVYGNLPWLVPMMPENVAVFFKENGILVYLKHGETIPFGPTQKLYFVEKGLLCSLPLHQGDNTHVCGLFSQGTLLGGVMALRSPGIGHLRSMSIFGRALVATRVREITLDLFTDWFLSQPFEHQRQLYQIAIAMTECQLEGVFINDRNPVYVRLLWALEVLGQCAVRLDKDSFVIPGGITLSDIAQIVHTNREMVSRAFSEAQRNEITVRRGRELVVNEKRLLLALDALL